MVSNVENNKRIAKNTLFLYFRMLFTMAVSLYTSRVALAILGVVDYGIYNVVGGVVAMFSIISGSLSVAISRYITFELGRGSRDRLNILFSTSVTILIVLAIFICIIAEIVGVWFLNNKMNIPADRLYAANWVLQCSILTFLINLISVPYNATIVAHEKMSAFAYISILEVSLKLVLVYMLYISPFDKLIVYSVLFVVLATIIRLVYGSYCKRHFEEARFRFVANKKLICEMMGFVGWAFFGNGVVVLKDQGSNVLLNLFCGPIVNAAQGIATQVNVAVFGLVSNFMVAVNPQITKSYSSGDLSYMHSLIIKSGKLAFFILLLLFFPLCVNIDYVLSLWLVKVPEHTSSFVVLILLYSLLDCFGNPLVTGVLAQGNIKRYEIVLTILYLANFFTSFLFLKSGYAPEWVFILNILFKIFVIGALLWHSKARYQFPIGQFMRQSVLRGLAVFVVCYCFVSVVKISLNNAFVSFIVSSGITFVFTAVVIFVIGLNKKESMFLLTTVKYRIFRRKSL